jgi:hypothetical protein
LLLVQRQQRQIFTFSAPPLSACKKEAAERNIECREKPAKKKRKTVAALDSNSNERDMVYPHSTSASASAKGLNSLSAMDGRDRPLLN